MSRPADEKYTICVDFDGVIHSYTSPWIDAATIPDPPVEGAIEWLNEISKSFAIVIHTTRGRELDGQLAVWNWLHERGYTGEAIVSNQKRPALIYIDDRGYRFEGPGTFPTADQIHQARPWNKAAA